VAENLARKSIGQILITLSDVGRAVEFYRAVLGLRFLFDAADGGPLTNLNTSARPLRYHPQECLRAPGGPGSLLSRG
jgi:catechol 2,3-dioxygenase-like lactoylglutathione lyase family enzyme